jgi:hypothetical protein
VTFIDTLCQQISTDADFRREYDDLLKHSVLRHIGQPSPLRLEEGALQRLMQSAAILSQSSRAQWRHLAYRIGFASLAAADVLDGLGAASRLVLARLGNYPAIKFAFGDGHEPETLPETIFYEIVNRRDANTVMVGDRSATLTDMQKRVWDGLASGQSLAMSAPTSAGKSFVLLGFIENLKRTRPTANIVYVVPSRALLSQVEGDLRKVTPDRAFGVTTVPIPPADGEDVPLYVLTPERLQVLLQASTELSFDVAIVDEAHLIGESSRGVILHSVLQELEARRPKTQFLFSSPHVRNPKTFGLVVGAGDIREIKDDNSPVAQNIVLLSGDLLESKTIGAILRYNEGDLPLGDIETAIPIYNSEDRLIYSAWALGRGSQSLVYADGPATCETVALKIQALSRDPQVGEVVPVAQVADETELVRTALSEFAKESVHHNYVLAETVRSGIGFHYGRIPPLLRSAVEAAFSEGHLDYIVCTSTLLQGVNLPARNIFMHNPHTGEERPIEPVDFWNLAGRAGRLGKDFQGNVFLVDYDNWESKPLTGPKDESIRPSLEKTLVDTPAELLDYIGDSQRPSGQSPQLEAAFSKLLRDHRRGNLQQTLDRMDGLAADTPRMVEQALKIADSAITLNASTLEASPQISGFRQQELYDYMIAKIAKKGPDYLIPVHPSASFNDALNKLRPVFARVHKYLELKSGRHHLYWAPLALRWMRGEALPSIIDSAIKYHKAQGKNRSDRTVIREVLTDIERDLRFKYVNLLSCYCAILKEALIATGHPAHVQKIPALPLYLELGAASQTMIQLIGFGLSRHTSSRLAGLTINRDMDQRAARSFLAGINPQTTGLSLYVTSELRRVLAAA